MKVVKGCIALDNPMHAIRKEMDKYRVVAERDEKRKKSNRAKLQKPPMRSIKDIESAMRYMTQTQMGVSKKDDERIRRCLKPMMLNALREAFDRIHKLAKLGRRDLSDLLVVAEKIRRNKDFMKQLVSMTLDYEKHHHEKTFGFG